MYIDPNTGGQLFQILAIILAGFSGFVLVFSSKIRAFFARLRRYRRDDFQRDEAAQEQKLDSPEDHQE